MCETGKEGVKMTEDKAVELINEWLELAKEVSDMNLNRMDVIRKKIQEYHEQMNKKRED